MPLPQSLSQSASAHSLFSKPSKLHQGNPFGETNKQITIKKILKDLEKDLHQVEEENYNIIRE